MYYLNIFVCSFFYFFFDGELLLLLYTILNNSTYINYISLDLSYLVKIRLLILSYIININK